MGLACIDIEERQRWSRIGDVFVHGEEGKASLDIGEAYHNSRGSVEISVVRKLYGPSKLYVQFDGFSFEEEQFQLPLSRELKAIVPNGKDATTEKTVGIVTISAGSASAEIQHVPENLLCLAF